MAGFLGRLLQIRNYAHLIRCIFVWYLTHDEVQAMAQQPFGGDWTTDKLDRLKRYLVEYIKILAKRPDLNTWYVDGFAGSGYIPAKAAQRADPANQTVLEIEDAEEHIADQQVANFINGSPRVALAVEPPFNRYLFIERDRKKAEELTALRYEYPALADRIHIEVQDANEFLIEWCRKTFNGKTRAVVFLDPFGMQV